MAFLNKLLPIALALFLSGCCEDFMPKVDSRPVLCLNSLITAGEPIEVSVTHTWLYTDEVSAADHSVDDARVVFHVNGEPVDAGYIPREGDVVKIVAESAIYGRAEAEVTVPCSVPAESVKWTATPVSVWKGDLPGWMLTDMSFTLNVELAVADPAQVVNYYHFDSHPFFPYEENGAGGSYDGTVVFGGGTLRTELEPIFTEHIGELDAISGNDTPYITFFTDCQFSGESYTLHLQYDNMTYYVNYEGYDERWLDCGLDLTLNSVSESFYNWVNYKWQAEDGCLGDIGDIGLGDPFWGYSNVSTGAGVVAARSSATYRISLKDFLRETVMPNE